ncbi:hypothetical protein AQUCO_01400744v1 [Aquilegia coerulea]|uniref:B30.2/SPRY domain-containing protein n=1 Tax=Aquilegia coerulea TaxID=218851 RepID=A0A2G5DY14_AQUCA|nr:hypothetical protein AQUCO_01400744v1 [Aquilegia coerulea]
MGSRFSKTPSSPTMESLTDTNIDEASEENIINIPINDNNNIPVTETIIPIISIPSENPQIEQINGEHEVFDEMSEGDVSEEDDDEDEEEEEEDELEPKPIICSEEENEESPNKKQKPLSLFTSQVETKVMEVDLVGSLGTMQATPTTVATLKKPQKKNNNVWTKPKSRKGKKKSKLNNNNGIAKEESVLITPISKFPDRSDDSPDMKICLSKVYKAEKVELSDDRLLAGSSKGYRMVRATRGVVEGAWYFEIKVSKLGESGHTRLGWSMEKGDLQAPVGYDGNSFGYRDIDGSKVHKAMREKYGDSGYSEGDVIGFYINLPDGCLYAPKPPHYVWYKGQKYMCATDGKEESLKVVPGSEICFFKNGVSQGVAFKDLYGGRYYPAASMYTLPNKPNCVVKFNFGPDFEYFPKDFECRPLPRPMIEVPYLVFDGGIENGDSDEKKN